MRLRMKYNDFDELLDEISYRLEEMDDRLDALNSSKDTEKSEIMMKSAKGLVEDIGQLTDKIRIRYEVELASDKIAKRIDILEANLDLHIRKVNSLSNHIVTLTSR